MPGGFFIGRVFGGRVFYRPGGLSGGPEDFDGIFADDAICGDQGQAFEDRLRDEQAIEGVTMMMRQRENR